MSSTRRPAVVLASAALAVASLGLTACGTSDSNAEGGTDTGTASQSTSESSPTSTSESTSSESTPTSESTASQPSTTKTSSSDTPSSPSTSSTQGIAIGEFKMPNGLSKDFSVTIGKKSAGKTLTVIEDFQCPACMQFEQVAGPLITKAVEKGATQVEYRPIAFLDHASTTQYSTRALNAAYCVLDEKGPGGFMTMHEELFKNQPEEGGDGLPDEKLIEFAKKAGATNADGCITGGTFEPVAKKSTEAAFNEGVQSTPTLRVDGKPLDVTGMSLEDFKKEIGAS